MENETIEKVSGTVYEISYLFVPHTSEENLPAKVTAIKDLVSERGGIFISEDHPKLIELAYQMDRTIANKKEKFTKAYFGWVKFELDPSKIEEISKILALNEEIIRFLVIKTIRENTLVSKKPFGKDSSRKPRASDEEAKLPINKEEVDAEIEKMVSAE